ncbi:MAG: DUF3332 family protein [Deltaproteobacteria bacterium]|nr:DUF3332 family protein [Deltaproteobacteria bacterium]
MKRAIAAVLIGSVLMLSLASCFGSFKAIRTVYKWNDSLDNKWVKTLVLWAFTIIPVYGVIALADAIVFNLIEFWTGDNPLTSGALPDGALAEFARVDDSTVRVRVIFTDGSETEFDVVRLGERALAVLAADGTLLSRTELCDDGTVALTAGGTNRPAPAADVE